MASTVTDRLLSGAGIAFKAPCRVATTANITLSGEQTIDDIAVVAGDRVLVKSQSTGADNGIYFCRASGWERAPDADGSFDLFQGTLVLIQQGTANADKLYELTTSGTITIGTTSQTWTERGIAPTLPLAVSSGGTGAATAADARTNLGLTLPLALASGGTGLSAASYNALLTGITATRTETGAAAVPVLNKLRETVSAKDFGATGDGTTDDTTALNNWLAAGGGHLPAGTYNTTAPLTITVSGTRILGDGWGKSVISCSDTDTAGITIAAFMENIDLRDFRLTRSVTAVSGGNGISNLGSCGQCLIHGVLVDSQYRGLSLSSTDFSTVRDCIVQECQDSGVFLTNTASNGSLQWSMHNVLSQKNVGRGFIIASTAGPSSVSLGTYSNLATFANTSNGLLVSGTVGVPIHGLRLENSFLGQDGATEISLDTHGGYHTIRDCHVELAGTRTTGPTLATAASDVGDGISLSANNLEAMLIGNDIDGNSLCGVRSSATKFVMVGNNVTNNGVAETVGELTGVKFVAGTALIVGNRVGNRGTGTQDIGILVNVDAATMIGNDLAGNNTSPVTLTVTPPVVSLTAHNGGYVTVNGGTATIASGTTSITVTHGLGRTPRAQELWFTPTENPTTDPANMWIDTITSTQFNINCRTNPGASNLDVSWGARLR